MRTHRRSREDRSRRAFAFGRAGATDGGAPQDETGDLLDSGADVLGVAGGSFDQDTRARNLARSVSPGTRLVRGAPW